MNLVIPSALLVLFVPKLSTWRNFRVANVIKFYLMCPFICSGHSIPSFEKNFFQGDLSLDRFDFRGELKTIIVNCKK